MKTFLVNGFEVLNCSPKPTNILHCHIAYSCKVSNSSQSLLDWITKSQDKFHRQLFPLEYVGSLNQALMNGQWKVSSMALQHSDTIEIHGRMIVDFYTGLTHAVFIRSHTVATIFFAACFCAATIQGRHLFLWKDRRHHWRRIMYIQAMQWQLLDAVSSMHTLTVLLLAMASIWRNTVCCYFSRAHGWEPSFCMHVQYNTMHKTHW